MREKKKYRLNSNTDYGYDSSMKKKTCRKSGYPRKKIEAFEGIRLNRRSHSYLTWRGCKDGGNYGDIEKQTRGLLAKFLGKPYDEFMRVYTERMEAVKHKFIPEFGYSSLEDYLNRNFIWSESNPRGIWPWRRDHLLFEVDENGLIQEHRV